MLNRNERRISGAQIKTAASLAAAACYGRDETGKNVTVDNRRARGALERAFAQLIRRGGKSFVMQVSEREALGFPGQQPHVANTVYALAVGLDAAGCGAYAIQGMGYVEHRKMPARIKRMADAEAFRMAAAMAQVELLEILDVDGLPETG